MGANVAVIDHTAGMNHGRPHRAPVDDYADDFEGLPDNTIRSRRRARRLVSDIAHKQEQAPLWRRSIWAQKIPAGLEAEYQAANNARTTRGVAILAWLGIVLVPTFLILGWIMFPELFWDFFLVRLGTDVVTFLYLAGLHVARKRGVAERYSTYFAYLLVAIFAASLDIIIAMAGGVDSPYYGGMGLLLIVVMAAFPFPATKMAAVLIVILAQFNLLLLLTQDVESWKLVINANFFLVSTVLIGVLIAISSHRMRVQEFLDHKVIEEEKAKNERLLLNIFPREVAEELREAGEVQTRHIESCTVLFSDFVGFTSMSTRVDPVDLVRSLDQAFRRFDEIVARHRLEKLKTIGDAYMCASGVLVSRPDHLIACVLAGLEMIDALDTEDLRAPDGSRWRMRLGIHSGPVVAGVIGTKKFAFDLWGNTVNTASRMESTGQPSSVNMSTAVYSTIQMLFEGEDRGFIPVRGKGPVSMTRVTGLRSQYAADKSRRRPNKLFFDAQADLLEQRGGVSGIHQLRHSLFGIPITRKTEFDPLRTFPMLIPEDRERLTEVADEVPVSEGQVLIEEGQDLSVLFLIVKGLFGVRMNRGGVAIEVAVLGPGQIAGELSFVSLEPASATVVALEDGAVLRFDLNRIQKMQEDMPGIGARLFHSFALVLARRVRVANARVFSADVVDDKLLSTLPTPQPASRELPAEIVDAMAALQVRLHPLASATEERPEARLQVAEACDALLSALAQDEDAPPDELVARGAAIRLEANRFLMRSMLLRVCQETSIANHQVLEAIVQDAPISQDPLGRLIDHWFLQLPVVRAIRQSARFAAAHIKRAHNPSVMQWRATSYASSSAPELFAAAEVLDLPANLRAVCIDENLADLAEAGHRAESLGLQKQFTFVRGNVQLQKGLRSQVKLVPQDFIFHRLLIPAIDDEAWIDILNEFHGLLVDGGALLIGQFHPDRRSELLLRYILGSPIASRTVSELGVLAGRSAFGANMALVHDAEDSGFSFVELWRDS